MVSSWVLVGIDREFYSELDMGQYLCWFDPEKLPKAETDGFCYFYQGQIIVHLGMGQRT